MHTSVALASNNMSCYNPPANYVIRQRVNQLANGSLFVHGSTHSQITLNTDPLTKSGHDVVDHRTDLIDHPYFMLLEIHVGITTVVLPLLTMYMLYDVRCGTIV